MANNISVKDAANATVAIKTTDGGVSHVPHHNIDAIAPGANRIGKVTVRNAADGADIDPVAEATFTGRVGEVQASPTANTLLGRLKDLLTGIVLAAGSAIIGAVRDAGVSWVPVQSYTTSADMSTAAAITPAPTAGQKVIADDILVSAGAAMEFSIQMETTATVLCSVFIPANGTVPITLCNKVRGDTVDKKLFGKASVAGQVRVFTSIHSE
jgi:hypothetical protein